MVYHHEVLEHGDFSKRQMVVRWLRRFPFAFLSDRDYCIARREFVEPDGSFYGISKVRSTGLKRSSLQVQHMQRMVWQHLCCSLTHQHACLLWCCLMRVEWQTHCVVTAAPCLMLLLCMTCGDCLWPAGCSRPPACVPWRPACDHGRVPLHVALQDCARPMGRRHTSMRDHPAAPRAVQDQ